MVNVPGDQLSRVRPARLKAACALLAIVWLAVAAACGGGGGDDGEPTAIREQAPPDSIAFGAQEGETGTPNGETYGLYLVRPDGEFLRSIVDETALVSSPVWSPTGDRIAYHVGGSGQTATATLRIYDFATDAATTVSDRALISSDLGPAMSWSTDGSRLAFAETNGGISIYDADRGVLEEGTVAEGHAVAWRPGEDELAIVRGGDLYLLDLDGGEERPLLERDVTDRMPVWSPDGESLAFANVGGDVPGRFILSVLTVEAGSITEIGPGSGAAWSPDGSSLAYSASVADDTPDVDIFVAATDGGPPDGGPPRAFAGPTTLDVSPAWSPDGGRIVYLARADARTSFICLVRLEPEERDCLALPGLLPTAPAWSPH